MASSGARARFGLSNEMCARIFCKDAEQCFSSTCDLRKTCYALTDLAMLKAFGSTLTVGQPFTPMLAMGYRGAAGTGSGHDARGPFV